MENKKKHILVVDDDDRIRTLIKQYLNDNNFIVSTASDAEAAKSKMIKQIQDETDTRKKNLFLDKEGKTFFEVVYNTQKKRIFNALKNSSSDSVIKFKNVLNKIIDGR